MHKKGASLCNNDVSHAYEGKGSREKSYGFNFL